MKKAFSMTMAALMAVSTGITVFAEDTEKSELETTLAMVKSRISVPEELTEFSYSTTKNGPITIYSFFWETPNDAEEYGFLGVNAYSSLISSYYKYDDSYYKYDSDGTLAKLSASELYTKATQAIKKLNPSLAKNIKIDKDSLSMSLNSNNAAFTVYRVKNGVPIKNDTGKIVIDKNTGELSNFYINWHPKASFKSTKGALSQDDAWTKYTELIDIQPQYEIVYDYTQKEYSSRLVYTQTGYGEINAYTGERSDFLADAFYSNDDTMFDEDCEESVAEDDAGGSLFTKQELEELSKDLPYGNEQAVINLVKENKYLTYTDNMSIEYDNLYKKTIGKEPQYIYTVSFSNASKDDYFGVDEVYAEENLEYDTIEEVPPIDDDGYVSMSITLDAQTGEILDYNYYNSNQTVGDSYNMTKADKRAAKVIKSLAPTHTSEYTNYTSSEKTYKQNDNSYACYGSHHNYGRVINGINVLGEDISISFDADMVLTNYSVAYHDVEFADIDNMLTAEQVMEKYRENNTLDLYYCARTGKKKTGTVLVYGCSETVYADAFTGEPIYSWTTEESDFSGITDAQLLNKAKILDYNGIVIMTNGKKQSDALTQSEFTSLISCITSSSSLYRLRGEMVLPSGALFSNDEQLLTRADAMVLYASAACGSKITELQGIFKNPFSDVDDADKFLGCYAAAYALGAVQGTELNGSAAYTYADVINLIYDNLA